MKKLVTRGGDGGAAAAHKDRCANEREVLTCGPEKDEAGDPAVFATLDPFDLAHRAKDHRGFLLPASELGKGVGRPRRYSACCLTSRGYSHDTAAEVLGRMVARLRRELCGEEIDVSAIRYGPMFGGMDGVAARRVVDRNERAFRIQRDEASAWLASADPAGAAPSE